ncbi:hypothetical protein C8R46DRAFT_1047515 [Mycena filopes]|nr:hypothetical protein C8R46DRAFT_1047515 [Mycena filopes]
MPEGNEISILLKFLLAFLSWMEEQPTPKPRLQVLGIWTDIRNMELPEMRVREEVILAYANTCQLDMLADGTHIPWAIRLGQLAAAIPDTHGLLIYDSQISRQYDDWNLFVEAICSLSAFDKKKPAILPQRWSKKSRPGMEGVKFNRPSQCKLAVALNRYCPVTWRGRNPDSRLPSSETATARASTASASRVGSGRGTASSGSSASRGSSRPNRGDASNRGASNASRGCLPTSLDGFITGGTSPKLAKFGVPEVLLNDIDTSRYLWPSALFPILNDESCKPIDAMKKTGMEWVGLEYDPRDIILDLKTCYLEVELLLHCTPQIFTVRQWLGVARTPDFKRGFKIVLAIEFNTHVLAFLSKDNNARVYWLSKNDMEATRAGRVPDIVHDFWGWSEFTARHLQGRGSKDDKKSAGSVLSEAGNQPGRGTGRYLRDEILNLAGVPPETMWGQIRRDPERLAQIYTAMRFVRMRQALQPSMKWNSAQTDGSFLLIRTTEDTVRFARELTVHGKLESRTSSRRKQLIDTYNALSDQTYQDASSDNFFVSNTKANMPPKALFFDPGEVAQAILVFDGLGPLLFRDWEAVLRVHGQAAVTDDIRSFYNHLPDSLTRLERLSLKPLPQLTSEERDELISLRGSSVNPLVRYLRGTQLGPIGSNPPLSLVKDLDRRPMRTYLYRDREDKAVWSLTRAPFSTTHPNPDYSPPNAVVFTVASEDDRRKDTVQYIQQHEKNESVGPLAFCGHAILINVNHNSSFVAPCLWHPDLSEAHQKLLSRARDAHRNPNVGMRKGTAAELKAQQTRRTTARKELRRELEREPTEAEIVVRARTNKATTDAKKKKVKQKVKVQPGLRVKSERLQNQRLKTSVPVEMDVDDNMDVEMAAISSVDLMIIDT